MTVRTATGRIRRRVRRSLPPARANPGGARLLHRPNLGLRRRHVFGALGLRPAVAEHTDSEAALLMRYGTEAETVVELGVAEGGSAAELRSVMSAAGQLFLIDPYPPGRLGVSMARIVARRTVRRVARGDVTWLRSRSDEAAAGWGRPIDFLFVDADHSYERAASDWRRWTPFVRAGGYVALHDSRVSPGGWIDERSGPVRLLEDIRRRERDWVVVDEVDSITVLRRDATVTAEVGNGMRRHPRGADRSTVGREGLHILRIADVEGTTTAGLSGYILHSAEEMERAGHRVSFWFHEALAPGLTQSGLRRLLVPWLIAFKVIWATLAGVRFDIVEINAMSGAPYGVISRALRPHLPACVVLSQGLDESGWQAHVAYLRGRGLVPPLRSRILIPLTLLSQARLALRTAEAVLLVSSEDARYAKDRMGVHADRVSLPHTGVSEELFGVERQAFSEMRVLFLGGWVERKGTNELVAAWRRLASERGGVRLTLAGVGDADRARADVAGLEGVEVIPLIERPELPGLLTQHDVFVLPSWHEGMSLAMLEAAAAGLACVVSGVAGSLDVFRREDPRRDGAILTPAGDVDALHRSLTELADDAGLRATLGARARERARRFTWASNAERTLGAYSAALERRHTAAARR